MSDGMSDGYRMEQEAIARAAREALRPDFIDDFRYKAGDLRDTLHTYWSQRSQYLGIEDDDEARHPHSRIREFRKLEELKPELIKSLRAMADMLEEKF